jgi:hypothetical protein
MIGNEANDQISLVTCKRRFYDLEGHEFIAVGMPITEHWMSAIFCGVSPAVIALIVHFCYLLAKLGMDAWVQWVIAAGCCLVTIWPGSQRGGAVCAAGILGILCYGSWFRGGRTPISMLVGAPLGHRHRKGADRIRAEPLACVFSEDRQPTSAVVSLSCPSSRKASCSRPNG